MDGHSGFKNELAEVDGVDSDGNVVLSYLTTEAGAGGTFVLHVKLPTVESLSGPSFADVYRMLGFKFSQSCNVLKGNPPCLYLELGSQGPQKDDALIREANNTTKWAAQNLHASVEQLKSLLTDLWRNMPQLPR